LFLVLGNFFFSSSFYLVSWGKMRENTNTTGNESAAVIQNTHNIIIIFICTYFFWLYFAPKQKGGRMLFSSHYTTFSMKNILLFFCIKLFFRCTWHGKRNINEKEEYLVCMYVSVRMERPFFIAPRAREERKYACRCVYVKKHTRNTHFSIIIIQ